MAISDIARMFGFGGVAPQTAAASQPLSIFDQARRQAAMQSMGAIGAQLMAMGVPQTASQRAQGAYQLAQVMGNSGGNVLNNAQMLLAERKIRDEEAARIDAARQWAQLSGMGGASMAPQGNTFGPRVQTATPTQPTPSTIPSEGTVAALVNQPLSQRPSSAQGSATDARLTPREISYLMQAYPTDVVARNAAAAELIYNKGAPKKPEYKEVNGRLVEVIDGQSRVVMDLSDPANADLDDRAKKAGLEPGSQDYIDFMLRGGTPAPQTPEEIAALEAAKLNQQEINSVFSEASKAGAQAGRKIAEIDRMGQLLSTSPQGLEGAVKFALGSFGIRSEGLDALQATQALISAMVPAQRPPGSGPMSDADLELFKQSLPRLINTPEGNRIILETLRGIAEYDRQGAEIVMRHRTGEISQAEAYKQLLNRPDPFGDFRAPSIQQGAPQGGGVRNWTPETGLSGVNQ